MKTNRSVGHGFNPSSGTWKRACTLTSQTGTRANNWPSERTAGACACAAARRLAGSGNGAARWKPVHHGPSSDWFGASIAAGKTHRDEARQCVTRYKTSAIDRATPGGPTPRSHAQAAERATERRIRITGGTRVTAATSSASHQGSMYRTS